MIVGFIDQYRQVYSVESICAALTEHGIQIVPRTYRKARFRPPADRDVADAHLENALRDLQGGQWGDLLRQGCRADRF